MRSLLLIFYLIVTFSANAQSWTEQVSNTTSDLAAIHFYSSTEGVAIGEDGTVVSTNDGGQSWVPASAGSDYDVLSAGFINNIIYAGGEMVSTGDGFIIKSSDKGQSWSALSTGLPERILGISFPDEDNGWIGGRKGLLQKTTDGGQTWEDGNSPSDDDILEVFFLTPDQGWISMEDGFIYFTGNGGTTWTSEPTGIDRDLYTIYFLDETLGFTSGEKGHLLAYASGGGSWASQSSNTGEDIMDLQMLDQHNAWAAGTGGVILNTTDGGTNWTVDAYPSFGELAAIHMIDNTVGWVCGEAGVIAKLGNDTTGSGELTALFTAPTDVCQDEVVSFADNSLGDIVAWEWDFGDGSPVELTPSAKHSFTADGTYHVTLTIEDAQGNTDESQQTINVHPKVTAAFSMSLDTINLSSGNTVILTNESANANIHEWDFGNGLTTSIEDPVAVYEAPGTYTIRLVAGNAGCTDTAEAQIVVMERVAGMANASAFNFDIYPNPATDHLMVRSALKIKKIVMMSILGEVVLEQNVNMVNKQRLDLNAFPSGIYLLTVFTQDNKITKRVKISR